MQTDGLDASFLQYACGILAETNSGLSGSKIVDLCSKYSLKYNREIPQCKYPFSPRNTNKRTAFRQNLDAFSRGEQFQIIKEIIDRPEFASNKDAVALRKILYDRFGDLMEEGITKSELVKKTKHWLLEHPSALRQYNSALEKYERRIYQRNALDDIRLAFELLLKDIFNNSKALENQLPSVRRMLSDANISVEFRNMFEKIIDYYTKYQNNHVKHDDLINENELEYVIELTSVVMKFLIKVSDAAK